MRYLIKKIFNGAHPEGPMATLPRSRGPFVCRFPVSCLIVCLAWQSAAAFAISERDLQIIARTLGFLDPPLTGEVEVGILFNPGSPASLQDAESIRDLLDGGMAGGSLVMNPVMVPMQQAGSADVDFFLLAEAAGETAGNLQETLQQRQLPCVTADLDQVRSGNCAVGIQSSPKVEILVNRDTAAAGGVNFASVFRMMVREL